MKRVDHRLKLMAGIALVCLTIIFLLGTTLYIASERMELALVEQLISEEMDFLIQRYEADSEYQPTQRPNVEHYILEEKAEEPILPVELRGLDQGHHELYINAVGGQRDVFIQDMDETRFLVIYDIGPYEDREYEFKQLILLSVLLALGLAVLLGYVLSGILTKQMSLLAQQVANLDPDQPYEPLINPEQEKEIAIMANAFDNYHKIFLGMIRREQDFTANVAHELRTPLTAIRTSCELLARNPVLDKKSLDRIKYIIQSVDSMDDHAEALLFLARGQKFNTDTTLYLKECVEDVLSGYLNELNSKGLHYEICIAPDISLLINRQALQLVLNNLFKNAIMYTEKGSIRIAFTKNKLIIRDTGCGIPTEQLSMIFERQYRAYKDKPGLGLGLDIVNRICKHCGWRIEVDSEMGNGTTFSINFDNGNSRVKTSAAFPAPAKKT